MLFSKLFEFNGTLLDFSPFKNLKVLFSRSRPELPDDALRFIERFDALMRGFRLRRPDILRIVPQEWGWTLGTLTEPRSLLNAMTAKRIDWLAQTFGVERSWLEGHSNIAVMPLDGYKHPSRCIDDLVKRGWCTDRLRMTVLAADYAGNNGPLGRYVIVFSYPWLVWDDGERPIYRHAVFESVMNWYHLPCVLDTLALARWFTTTSRGFDAIPIVPATEEAVARIGQGSELPGAHFTDHIGGYDRLEDRVLGESESAVACPSPILPAALEYADQMLGEHLRTRRLLSA